MKARNYIPSLFAVAVLFVLMAAFPPFQITWRQFFFAEPASFLHKLNFLSKVYGIPLCLSFVAIVLFQLQGRLSMVGASASSVFPMALFGAAGMMTAFRSIVSGVGGVPGYALGMALAYTVMSRIHSIQPSGRVRFGRPMLRIVWKGQIEAQAHAAAELQARGLAPGLEQRSVSSSTSNSAKNSSLSLSRAEAGM